MKIIDSIMNKVYKPKGNLLIINGGFNGKRDPRFTYNKNERFLEIAGYIEKPAQEGVKKLYSKNIYTYYSEGGCKYHGYPDYLFVLSRLFNENSEIARRNNFILDSVEHNENKSEIIKLVHPENVDVGYYLLGINRKSMSDKEAGKKFSSLVDMLEMQEDDLAGRGEGVFKKERPEIEQLSSILDKI